MCNGMKSIGRKIKTDLPLSLVPSAMFLCTTFIMVLAAKYWGTEKINFSVSFLLQLLICLSSVYFTNTNRISALFSTLLVFSAIPLSFYLGFILWLELGLPY